MLRTATICNGQSKLIACLPEEGIKLSGAFYGKRSGKDCHGDLPYKDDSPTCSALDAKSKIQEECNGKQTCLLFADENVYGKSLCPNVNKYLHVDYFCFPRSVLDDIAAKKIHAALQEDLEEDAVSRSTDPTIQGIRVERMSYICILKTVYGAPPLLSLSPSLSIYIIYFIYIIYHC